MGFRSRAGRAVRWALFVPGAAVASYLSWLVIDLINRVTMYPYVNPDSFMGRAYLESVSHMGMGAAFVYVGSRIAPDRRRTIAYALAGLAILGAGFMSFPAVAQRNWWALFAAFCLATGAGGVAYAVAEGELDLDSH